MNSLMFVILILGALCIDTSVAQGNCEIRTSSSGKISDVQRLRRFISVTKCWIIKVPANSETFIQVTKLTNDRTLYTNVQLTVGDRTEKAPLNSKFEVKTSVDTKITFFAENVRNAYEMKAEFELNYKIDTLVLPTDPTEGTTASTTVATESTSVTPVGPNECTVLTKERTETLQLLKDLSFRNGTWGYDTPRALIAIHLANGTNFDETCDQTVLAKNLELQILRYVSSGGTSAKQLATFINALVAICANPAGFHGYNLYESLEKKLGDRNVSTGLNEDALFSLANCFSGKTMSDEELEYMAEAFKEPAETKGDLERRYHVAMALACTARLGSKINTTVIDEVCGEMMAKQMTSGSFNNDVITTATYVQIFMANNKIDDNRWNFKKAVKYLTEEVRKSKEIDPLLLTLPVLGCRTMADISCPRKRRESDLKQNESGMTLSLRYEDIKVFSIHLEVKDNISALQFLEFAATQDPAIK